METDSTEFYPLALIFLPGALARAQTQLSQYILQELGVRVSPNETYLNKLKQQQQQQQTLENYSLKPKA